MKQDFPEVKGKTVETVQLSAEAGYYGISVCFTDKTALAFTIEPRAITFPIYADWTGGEEKIIKEYPPVSSEVTLETEAKLEES
jgi:hypothetical protein